MDTKDYMGLGILLAQNFEKTAAEKAGEDLWLDAYCAGLEAGLGVEEGSANITKVACQLVGRAIMSDFIPAMMLEK